MGSTDDDRRRFGFRPDTMPAAAFLLLLLVLAMHRVLSADLWLHLTAGRWMVEHVRVPREDVFSFTAAGHPWIDLHWGYQLLVTAAHSVGGMVGVQLLHAAVLLATALLALRLVGGAVTSGAGAAFGSLVLLAGQERILNRPEIFTAFFLVATWWASERLASAHPPKRRYLLLQVAWANMQGLFILGPVLMFVRAAGTWIDGRVRPGSVHPGSVRRLVLAAAAMLVVSVCNPYGLEGVRLPFRLALQVSGDSIYAPILAELRSPWIGRGTPLLVGLLMASSLLAWIAGSRRAKDLLPMLAFGALAWSARRNVLLFGWMAFVPTWRALASMEASRLSARASTALRASVTVGIVVTIVAVTGGRFYHEVRSSKTTGFGVSAHDYPIGSARFLAANPDGGRLYNMLGDGDYFMWHLMPAWRVIFDGRAEVYGEELGRALLASVLADDTFAAVTRRFPVDALTMDPTSAVGRRFIQRRVSDPDWALVFMDHRGVVFYPASVVDSARVVSDETWRSRSLPAPRRLAWFDPIVRFPFAAARKGQLSAALGFYGRAANAYGDAIDAFPHSADLYADYGAALLHVGAPAAAGLAFAGARQLDPDHDAAAAGLARVREVEGQRAEAIATLTAWCTAHPGARRAWLTLADLHTRDGDVAASLETLEKALRRIPAARLPYARLLARVGRVREARDVLEPYVRQHGEDVDAQAVFDRLNAALRASEPTEKVDVEAR